MVKPVVFPVLWEFELPSPCEVPIARGRATPAVTDLEPSCSERTSLSFCVTLRHAIVISAGDKGTVIRESMKLLSPIPLIKLSN